MEDVINTITPLFCVIFTIYIMTISQIIFNGGIIMDKNKLKRDLSVAGNVAKTEFMALYNIVFILVIAIAILTGHWIFAVGIFFGWRCYKRYITNPNAYAYTEPIGTDEEVDE